MLKVGLKGITFFFLVVRPLRKMGRSRREQPAHRRSIHYRRGFGTFCPQGSFPCSRGSVPEVPYSDVPPCALSRTPHLSRPPCAFLFVSVPGRTASAARAGTVTALEKAPRSWLSPFAACLRCKGAGHEVFLFLRRHRRRLQLAGRKRLAQRRLKYVEWRQECAAAIDVPAQQRGGGLQQHRLPPLPPLRQLHRCWRPCLRPWREQCGRLIAGTASAADSGRRAPCW